jgi:hypothetical protein
MPEMHCSCLTFPRSRDVDDCHRVCGRCLLAFFLFRYDYYTIQLDDESGDVTITTTATDNPYGVWTYIGRAYQPIDGDSDWDRVRTDPLRAHLQPASFAVAPPCTPTAFVVAGTAWLHLFGADTRVPA